MGGMGAGLKTVVTGTALIYNLRPWNVQRNLLLETKVLEALYSQRFQGHMVVNFTSISYQISSLQIFSIEILSFIFLKGHKNEGFVIIAAEL